MRFLLLAFLIFFHMGCTRSQTNLRTSDGSIESVNVLAPDDVSRSESAYIRFRKDFKSFWYRQYGSYGLQYEEPIPLFDLKSTCNGFSMYAVKLGELMIYDSRSGRRGENKIYEKGFGMHGADGPAIALFVEEQKRNYRPKFVKIFHGNVIDLLGAVSNSQGGVKDCPDFYVRLQGGFFGRSKTQYGVGILSYEKGKYVIRSSATEIQGSFNELR